MNIDIIGGGTVSHIRNHLALSAVAYGNTAKQLGEYCSKTFNNPQINVHLTKMASGGAGSLETNEDIVKLVDDLIANPQTKIIFFNPALVDYSAIVEDRDLAEFGKFRKSGKYEERLKTSEGCQILCLTPSDKIISKIRKNRKDIFLVGFKTTCGATEDEQFLSGLNLLKLSSCNLVLANDTKTRVNMIITPEQARYAVSTDRQSTLKNLVAMTESRSQSKFTKSTVVEGQPVDWNNELIPQSLRTVVNFCIEKGAYKPFLKSTVGHFAVKVDEKTFLTSRRKTNFNNLDKVGLVKVESNGLDSVIAHGSKPSVGGQSQRIIFKEHPETDCIVHFHCPPLPGTHLSTRSQWWYECGSHECGQNTSDGLKLVDDGIKCVYLDKHGPNIVFNRNINPQKVIDFISKNFDLSKSTDEVDRTLMKVA